MSYCHDVLNVLTVAFWKMSHKKTSQGNGRAWRSQEECRRMEWYKGINEFVYVDSCLQIAAVTWCCG